MFSTRTAFVVEKKRWERGKQYANPMACEQITDVKADMVVVGFAEKKNKKKTTGER